MVGAERFLGEGLEGDLAGSLEVASQEHAALSPRAELAENLVAPRDPLALHVSSLAVFTTAPRSRKSHRCASAEPAALRRAEGKASSGHIGSGRWLLRRGAEHLLGEGFDAGVDLVEGEAAVGRDREDSHCAVEEEEDLVSEANVGEALHAEDVS